ncbi:MAG: response regulator, partial [Sphingomonadaceae bacterium]|nr:response regulator [Sphingomonadaceae bacterium]
ADTLEDAVAARTAELEQANADLREEAAERAVAEEKLRQIQKMEAVGQLTGGIAHDFNNMLAVVVGGLDLARRKVASSPDEAGRHIDNALEGANRAAALTRRLLAFARAEPLLPEGTDPVALIHGMHDLMERTIGERIAVSVIAPDDIWPVWVDPHQLENAVLNLAVNARDAMDGAGALTIDVRNTMLAEHEIGEAAAGEYIRIAVSDTGTGMAPEVVERAFEPFFTTKPLGKGTGLGLSQIFGFARQSGGDVAIDSTPGEGATVALYLPRFAGDATSRDRAADAFARLPEAGEGEALIILIVEDDERVRRATVGAVEELGHVAIACASGEAAEEALAARDDIGLLLTDVMMHGMTGPELVERIAPRYPDLAIIFVTGYVGEAGDAERFAGREVLRKPFTITALEAAIVAARAKAASGSPPEAAAEAAE